MVGGGGTLSSTIHSARNICQRINNTRDRRQLLQLIGQCTAADCVIILAFLNGNWVDDTYSRWSYYYMQHLRGWHQYCVWCRRCLGPVVPQFPDVPDKLKEAKKICCSSFLQIIWLGFLNTDFHSLIISRFICTRLKRNKKYSLTSLWLNVSIFSTLLSTLSVFVGQKHTEYFNLGMLCSALLSEIGDAGEKIKVPRHTHTHTHSLTHRHYNIKLHHQCTATVTACNYITALASICYYVVVCWTSLPCA